MEKAKKYLKSIFNTNISFYDIDAIDKFNLPIYISDNFIISYMVLKDTALEYILVKEKNKSVLNINRLKKQCTQIEKYTKHKVVYVFDNLRLTQRNNLINECIPFLVPNFQVYIPNQIINLMEADQVLQEYGDEFQKSTQVIFAYLLINDIKQFNAHKLAEDIHYSVATVNRAIRELVYRNLVLEKGNSTRKTYEMINKKSYWNTGKKYLFNPCVKQYYFKPEICKQHRTYMSNETALFRLSIEFNESDLLTSYYAVSQKEFALYNKEDILNEYDIFDNDYSVIEKFKYDPAMLSDSNYIDIVSLYAQFKNVHDERIEIALDKLIGELLNG